MAWVNDWQPLVCTLWCVWVVYMQLYVIGSIYEINYIVFFIIQMKSVAKTIILLYLLYYYIQLYWSYPTQWCTSSRGSQVLYHPLFSFLTITFPCPHFVQSTYMVFPSHCSYRQVVRERFLGGARLCSILVSLT